MSVLVFANGDIEGGLDWQRPLLINPTAIIAADGGSRHLHALNQQPDMVIGDMDSLSDEVRDWLDDAVVTITYPTAKDETDLELALLYAADHYSDDILLIGAFGGRLDQMLANILLLAHPRLQKRRVELVSQYQRAWLVADKTEISGNVGDTISLIPLGGDVRVATTTGLAWPLSDEVLAFGPARGISNTLTAVDATVELASGQLLCVHTSQTWQR